jgi:hypothetical protein
MVPAIAKGSAWQHAPVHCAGMILYGYMSPLTDKLDDLSLQFSIVKARAVAICDQPTLTAQDRINFLECMELLDEICDYARRLQRHGEKWRIYEN